MRPKRCGSEPSLLRHGLVVLAQFKDQDAALDGIDIERLAGISRSTAQQCLVKLSGLGYLRHASAGRYRLAGRSGGIRTRRGESGTAGTPA
jgi:DNA-binding IclR family transcriptional regulator